MLRPPRMAEVMSGYAGARGDTAGDMDSEADLECDVELRLRCVPEWLAVARTVVADIAVHADFDLDSIDDLKIAVDESGSQLMRLCNADGGESPEAGTLWCHFSVSGGELLAELTVDAVAGDGSGDSLHGRFGWHVLAVVTDDVRTEHVSMDGGGAGTRITMRKRKAVPSTA